MPVAAVCVSVVQAVSSPERLAAKADVSIAAGSAPTGEVVGVSKIQGAASGPDIGRVEAAVVARAAVALVALVKALGPGDVVADFLGLALVFAQGAALNNNGFVAPGHVDFDRKSILPLEVKVQAVLGAELVPAAVPARDVAHENVVRRRRGLRTGVGKEARAPGAHTGPAGCVVGWGGVGRCKRHGR